MSDFSFYRTLMTKNNKKSYPKIAFNIFNINLDYFTSINSTSNTNVAFGGITPPAPEVP